MSSSVRVLDVPTASMLVLVIMVIIEITKAGWLLLA
jgi:hypothetical protein